MKKEKLTKQKKAELWDKLCRLVEAGENPEFNTFSEGYLAITHGGFFRGKSMEEAMDHVEEKKL